MGIERFVAYPSIKYFLYVKTATRFPPTAIECFVKKIMEKAVVIFTAIRLREVSK